MVTLQCYGDSHFHRKKYNSALQSTEGFTTIPLSHGVPLDIWQVLLLLHFPTCCELLASEWPSEMQCFFIYELGRMCPWWCCRPGFRVAIGDVAPSTPHATAHLVTGLGDIGMGLLLGLRSVTVQLHFLQEAVFEQIKSQKEAS